MVRLILSIMNSQVSELKEHLRMNGYHVDFEDDDILDVDEDEVIEVKTILADRGIGCYEE